MGAYPVYKNAYKRYEKARETAGILTVEDAAYVRKMEVLTRTATTMSISKLIDPNKLRTDLEYKLIDANSLKAMDLKLVNGVYADGSTTRIWDDNFTEEQIWRFSPNGDGTYAVVNPDSGKVMGIENNSTANYARVKLYSKTNGLGQKWQLIYNREDDTYTLYNPNSNKELNINGAAMTNGAYAIMYPQIECPHLREK